MTILIFFICLGASIAGSICGIGGGVIIKPLLDMLGIMSISAISFLSGLTVMSMAAISVFRQRKLRLVDLRTGSLLAVGAAVGGAAGNAVFQAVKAYAGHDRLVGSLQAAVLAAVTLLTLIYSAFLREKLPAYRVHAAPACALLGGVMGLMSAFLGIGGGPINLAILYFAFSMDTKKAAANSLYIILFSQISSLIASLCKGTVPDFPLHCLPVMTAAGVIGGMLGTRINRSLSASAAARLFDVLLLAVIGICICNAVRFAR